MILFFGDSFTSAENNHEQGFVEKLNISDNINFGISGSTIGDYNIYPVIDGDLFANLKKHESKVRLADKIVLEYGINDTSAAVVRNLQIQPIIDFVKCIDYIKQLNPHAIIYFISLENMIEKLATSQFNYLMADYYKDIRDIYFKDITIEDFVPTWILCYQGLVENIEKIVDYVIELPKLDIDEWDEDDGIHPNDKGYQKFADYMKEKLYEDYITNRC